VAVHEGAVEVGLRHVIGPVFFSFPGPDGLEWSDRLALAQAWPAELDRIGGPYVPRALMPHAPFTVGIDHLREISVLAAEQQALVHTHASENDQDNADTIAQTGCRPVGALEAAGLLGRRLVLGHGVRLDDEEVTLLAAGSAAVAHCPGSNLKLASGAADVVAYRTAGVDVGLGTDGCSSSNDLDMFAVMRLAANLARLVREDPAAISAREVVAMATIEGARALGMADHIGTLEVGKEADIVLLRTDVPHLVPLHDPYTAIVFSAGRADVSHVLVAGEVVVDGHRSTRVDASDVMAAALGHVGRT
jgi:5-methylthioadenosine/S-adenosylhomocysteine deaminase